MTQLNDETKLNEMAKKKSDYTKDYRRRNRVTVNEKARQNRQRVRLALEVKRLEYKKRPEVDNINNTYIKMYAKSLGIKTSQSTYDLIKSDLIHEIFEHLKEQYTEAEITQRIHDYVNLVSAPIDIPS